MCAVHFFLSSSTIDAATIEFNPIRIAFNQHQIESIKLTNKESKPVTVQLDVFLWQQTQSAEDKLTPTQDLLATPSIVTIPPNTTQLVRVAKRMQSDSMDTQSYRLIVREIINQATHTEQQNLQVTLQSSLPIFMQPLKEPSYFHRILFILERPYLEIRNEGAQPILVTRYKIFSADNKAVLAEHKMFKYILPNAHYHHPLPMDIPAQVKVELVAH